MQKDFKDWHNKKELLDKGLVRPFFHEREIWFCSLGANVGYEQDGNGEDFQRPVVILKKFNNEIFWGIPLTKIKRAINKNSDKYYFVFSFVKDVKSAAILSQIRLIDGKRLSRVIGSIAKPEFKNLTKKLKELIP
ncbi:MAG: type II toxin-antitoxin system PemK/MazF family toxin [bacterium]|nr:type II toxin-antitoxin system PemK/MazF family toxin [bacterium]